MVCDYREKLVKDKNSSDILVNEIHYEDSYLT